MRLTRRVAVAIFCLLVGAGLAYAREIQQGDQCAVGDGQTVAGNLLVLCRTLVIDGHVTGNLIGLATSAVINGTVDGDVYLVAGQLDVRGTIGEDLHYAGPVLRVLDGSRFTSPRADLMSLSFSTALFPDSELPGSVVAVGYQLLLQGTVGSEVSFWGSSLLITGDVNGNVDAQVGDVNADVSQLETLLIPVPLDIKPVAPGLRIGESARVRGQVTYAAPSEGEIAEGALSRPALFRSVAIQPDFTQALGQQDGSLGVAVYLSEVIRQFVAIVAIGTVALLLTPRAVQSPLRNLQARPLVCLGVGLLTFIFSFVAVPFLALLTVLVLIIVSLLQVNELTIAVGAILTVADIGLTATILFVAIFLSRVVFCLAIGRLIVRLVFGDDGSLRSLLVGLAIGALLLAFLAALPAAGLIFNALAAFLGLGAMLTIVQARAQRAREAAMSARYITVTPPQLPRLSDEGRVVVPPPPPVIDTTSRPLGMDNLPDGFTWWEDEE